MDEVGRVSCGAAGGWQAALPDGRERQLAAIEVESNQRESWTALLSLAAATAFALAQPIYQLLGENAEFLVAHHVDRLDLLVLVGALSLLPALAGWVVVSAVGSVSRSAGRALLCGLVGLGLAATLLPPLHRTLELPGGVLVGTASLTGLLAGLAYARSAKLRSFAALLSLAAVGFPLWFALLGPASRAVTDGAQAELPLVRIDADTPVVLVVFDQLPLFSLLDPDERIDAQRHPGFAALAERADWFRNGTTVSPATEMAVPAILTGRYPRTRKLPTWTDHPQNLFSLLGHDYRLNVMQSLTDLCPPRHCTRTAATPPRSARIRTLLSDVRLLYLHGLLPPAWTGSLPDVTRTWRDFEAGTWISPGATRDDPHASWGDPTRVFERFVAGVDARSTRVLHFLHINLPHVPWKYFPSGTSYGPVGRNLYPYPMNGLTEIGVDDEWALNRALQRHLLQVGYADRLLAQLIERLETLGIYDDALLIVTADHGISFWPGESPLDTADTRMASDVMNVPIFVKRPQQTRGTIDDTNVEVVDLLPTIADVLGFEIPEPIDGRSVYDTAASRRTAKQLFVEFPDTGIVHVEHAPRLGGRRLSQDRIVRAFGPADHPDRWFVVGPRKAWIGKPLDDFRIKHDRSQRIELDHAEAYADVDLTSGLLPARVTGEARGEPPAAEVAIALNGRVEAVVHTYASGPDSATFSAVLRESAFREGSNSLEVFVVDPRATSPSLLSTSQLARGDWRLVTQAGREVALERSDGRRVPLRAAALTGEVGARGPMIAGWARSLPGDSAPESILFFANGRFHEEQQPARTRSRQTARVQAEQGGAVTLAFDAVIPFGKLRSQAQPEIRVFAVAADAATELSYAEAFPYRAATPGE
jgi:hypothetical protein